MTDRSSAKALAQWGLPATDLGSFIISLILGKAACGGEFKGGRNLVALALASSHLCRQRSKVSVEWSG